MLHHLTSSKQNCVIAAPWLPRVAWKSVINRFNKAAKDATFKDSYLFELFSASSPLVHSMPSSLATVCLAVDAALLHLCSPHAAEGSVEVSLAALHKASATINSCLKCHCVKDAQDGMSSQLKQDPFRLNGLMCDLDWRILLRRERGRVETTAMYPAD